MQQRLDRFKHCYDQLSAETLSREFLSRVYHPDVEFIDPFHRIQGLDELTEYFRGMYRAIDHIHFDYGTALNSEHESSLCWLMSFAHPAIASGETIQVEGMTQLIWQEDRVIKHRDFFDGAEMIYNHLPLIGWTLAKVRQRMNPG